MNKPQRTLRTPRFFILWALAVFAIAALVAVPQSFAQDESASAEDSSHLYAPEFCEFETTFPSEPYESQRCDPAGKNCHKMMSYTEVFELYSTVNFRVICTPLQPEAAKEYSDEVMLATLRAMTTSTVVEEFNTNVREGNGYKQAALVGEGRVGRTPMIYIAQMWLGEKSAMTVEAELIGGEHPDGDQLFSDILRSIRPIAERPKPAEEPEESTDNKDSDKKEESE